MPVAMKAYITWFGEPVRWAAHTERSDEDPTGEASEHATAAEAVAWARARTDWILVVTDPPQWAGSPEKKPSDVIETWQKEG